MSPLKWQKAIFWCYVLSRAQVFLQGSMRIQPWNLDGSAPSEHVSFKEAVMFSLGSNAFTLTSSASLLGSYGIHIVLTPK